MREYKPIFAKFIKDTTGRLWFFDHRWQCIGNMESDLSDIKIVMRFDEDQIRQCGAASNLLIKDDLLYITFFKKPDLLEYNIKKHTYKLYKNHLETPQLSQQYFSVFYETTVIFIPMDISKPIYSFDFNARCYSYMAGNEKIYTGNVYNLIQDDKKILLPVYGTNKILVMELDKSESEIITLDKDTAVYDICGIEEDLWICQNNKKVLVNLRDGQTSYITLAGEDHILKDPFSKLIKYKDKIIVLPRFDEHIYVVELSNLRIKEITLDFDQEEFKNRGCSLMYGYYLYEDTVYLLPWGLDEIVALQLSDYQITKKRLQITEDDYMKFIYQSPGIESEENNLRDYLKWIQKR